nr:GNAT family N-acetyltransferase [Holospora curviuscula]
MCSLRKNDGIRPGIIPWLGSLVVDPKYQKQGIGSMLIDMTLLKVKELCFKKLYLFAFDPAILEYYERLGWSQICMDEFTSHPVTVMEVDL